MDVGEIFLVLGSISMLASIASFLKASYERDEYYISLGKYLLVATFIFINLASFTLLYYFYIKDFQVLYVAKHVDKALPLLYTLSAFYAGAEGSLLLWVWIAMYFALGMFLFDKKDPLSLISLSIYLMTTFFLLFLVLTESNPFVRLDFTPEDGLGLNPLLQDIGMVMHPPLLFVGYAGLAIPFAYAMAGLILQNDRWVFRIRRWTIFSWLFLSYGILFGGWWSYRVLGWGGYWAWDPVENASLLPWLTSTALIHSVMIQEARRGLKTWNTLLSIFTYEFVILGTFLTRSGVLASVHAFGQSAVGHHFLTYLAAVMVISVTVVFWRYDYLMETSIDIFEAPLSKEMTFLMNNILFMVSATTIFWGTWFPMIHEAVVGSKVSVGPIYYNTIMGPMIWLIILLMGICVVFPWRRTSGKLILERLKVPALASLFLTGVMYLIGFRRFEAYTTLYITNLAIITTIQDFILEIRRGGKSGILRRALKLIVHKRRKYGGYIIHLAMFMMVFGLVGTQFYMETYSIQLSEGESYDIGNYVIVYRGAETISSETKVVWIATVDIYRDGVKLGEAHPKIIKSLKNNQITYRVDTYYIQSIIGDLYFVFEFIGDQGAAGFKVEIMPLIKLLWYSGYVMTLGVALALLPRGVVEKI